MDTPLDLKTAVHPKGSGPLVLDSRLAKQPGGAPVALDPKTVTPKKPMKKVRP